MTDDAIDYERAYTQSVAAHMRCDADRADLRQRIRDLEATSANEHALREQARTERDEARREMHDLALRLGVAAERENALRAEIAGLMRVEQELRIELERLRYALTKRESA